LTTIERLRPLVDSVLRARELELYDLELSGSTLRVLADREGGVDLDALSKASGELSAALDGAEPVPGRWVLEVSSPGVERKLRTPHHFRSALGRTVTVKTVAGTDGERRLTGVLTAADDDGVTVSGDAGERRLAYGDIERARTVFEWGANPPAGRGRRKRTRT
jgi:ribosome maturation factor RimP